MRNAATIQTVKTADGHGDTLTTEQIRARNVAVVMVTARIASSAPGPIGRCRGEFTGDAISLEGGVLLMTPLMKTKRRTYLCCGSRPDCDGFIHCEPKWFVIS